MVHFSSQTHCYTAQNVTLSTVTLQSCIVTKFHQGGPSVASNSEIRHVGINDRRELQRKTRDSSVGTGTDYGLEDGMIEFRRRVEIFLFDTESRPALGPTQPPIQWVPGALSLGVKRLAHEADYSPPSSA
jgi:hypothetical protein